MGVAMPGLKLYSMNNRNYIFKGSFDELNKIQSYFWKIFVQKINFSIFSDDKKTFMKLKIRI